MKKENSQNIGERFALLLKGLKMSNNAFAKSIGKSSTGINYIVDGKSKPGYDVLESTFEVYPQVNPDWLLRGNGEMFISEKQKFESPTDNTLNGLLQTLSDLAAQLRDKDNEIKQANNRADGLQRTIDFLISRPGVAAGANFLNGVAAGRSVVRMHPATLAAGQVA